MNLNILWFILVATLFCVYFFLDGMDFGIGMLIPFLGKEDKKNQKMIHAIGPTWGANEVWLITAGGAMFAAFPNWYATMFSGFYIALFLLLVALIIRGISIEFREKAATDFGKKIYNIGIALGNFLVPLLLVVAIACLLRGVPIDKSMEYTGTLWSLFSPFTLLAGVTGIAFFLYHGAIILKVKEGKEIKGVEQVISMTGLICTIGLVLTLLTGFFETDLFAKPISAIFAILSLVLLLVSYVFSKKKISLVNIALNAVFVIITIIAVFSAMFPNVMISNTKEAYNLTIYNASSSPYTLSVISVITITLLPIVIGYTIWTYYVFSKKTKGNGEKVGY